MAQEKRLVMVVDRRACLDCEACKVACKAENEVPLGHSRNWVRLQERGRFPLVGVQIEPGQCMHCDNAPCVRVCPTGASRVIAGGIVVVDADDCIGCRYCMEACPYDARYFHEESGTVDKCTFCEHRLQRGLEPACVSTCPTKVRLFGDANDPQSEVARMLETQRVEVEKAEAGTEPKVYYIA